MDAVVNELNGEKAGTKLIRAACDILSALADAIGNNTALLSGIILGILDFLLNDVATPENVDRIGRTAIYIINSLKEKLLAKENIDKIYTAAGEIVREFLLGWTEYDTSGDLYEFVKDLFTTLVSTIQSFRWKDIGAIVTDAFLSGLTGKDVDIFEKFNDLLNDPFNSTLDKLKEDINEAPRSSGGSSRSDVNSALENGNTLAQIIADAKSDQKSYNEEDVSSFISKIKKEDIESFKTAFAEMQSGIASNVTNNSSVDNSQQITYNITNNNTFETPMSRPDIQDIAEQLADEQAKNRKGRGK